ncbi:hypothetical protein CDL15_Pgr021368 [Punica granatum]|nr:hypothetical protein CDL15_Pgr021368 [Punica granatum]
MKGGAKILALLITVSLAELTSVIPRPIFLCKCCGLERQNFSLACVGALVIALRWLFPGPLTYPLYAIGQLNHIWKIIATFFFGAAIILISVWSPSKCSGAFFLAMISVLLTSEAKLSSLNGVNIPYICIIQLRYVLINHARVNLNDFYGIQLGESEMKEEHAILLLLVPSLIITLLIWAFGGKYTREEAVEAFALLS